MSRRARSWATLVALMLTLLSVFSPATTTTVSASAFTYDVPASARAGAVENVAVETGPAQLSDVWERSASPSVEVRGASTTPSGSVVATNTVDDILSRPVVANTKLQNIVNDLYKGTTNPSRVGTGTTADAVRNELATGLATGGKFHSEKAQIYINGLNKVLKQDLTASDRLVAQSLLDDLTNALGGAP